MAAIALAVGGYMFFNSKKGDTEEQESLESKSVWNPYSEESSHLVTLSDALLSASGGDYVVKMTNTIKFADEDAYLKFKGYPSHEEGIKGLEGDGGHGGEEVVTPMEIKINDTMSDLILKATEGQILDKKVLKTYLLEGINKELGFEEPIIADLYIENYVIQ